MSEIIYKLVHKSGAVLELPPHTQLTVEHVACMDGVTWRIMFPDGQRFNMYDRDREWTCYKQTTRVDIDLN